MRRRLGWTLLTLWVILVAVDATLDVSRGEPVDALFAPALVVFAGVGALLATRVPANPIGWLLLAVALLVAATEVAQGLYSMHRRGCAQVRSLTACCGSTTGPSRSGWG